MATPRTRLDVRHKVLGVDDCYFFLPVVFFVFFAFFAFLAMLPSAIPRMVQCKSTLTCINTEYTTIAKLIGRASKKVNSGHNVAHCRVSEPLSQVLASCADTAGCTAGEHL